MTTSQTFLSQSSNSFKIVKRIKNNLSLNFGFVSGKNDYRGELEVRTAFTVKATQNEIGSTADLSGKSKNSHKGSLQSLNKAAANFGGSLLNLGQKVRHSLKLI